MARTSLMLGNGGSAEMAPTVLHRLALSLGNLLRWLLSLLQSLWHRSTGEIIHLDTGRQVRLGKQLAQGGFSLVFEAIDVSYGKRYAIKRILMAGDEEIWRACRSEAGVHRAVRHPNVMPLLGLTMVGDSAYMLFPLLDGSLREQVNRRCFTDTAYDNARAPWSMVEALQLFLGIVRGVGALHHAGWAHCDVKLENVLLQGRTPVLMDLGSAAPLTPLALSSRRVVAQVVERAASHTTLPYRPPELFEGGLRVGDPPLDYAAVDVWSLGCTLFAILFGASPFEAEFSRTHGRLKIVDCTSLSILGTVPRPPPATPPAEWYPDAVWQLIIDMLEPDRLRRISLEEVQARVEASIEQWGGTVPELDQSMEVEDEGIALMSTNRLV